MKLGFTIDESGDSDGGTLHSARAARLAYKRMRATRSWIIRFAIMAVIIGLEAIWSDLLPLNIRLFALAAFAGILFLSIQASIEQVISSRRVKRSMASNKGVTPKDTAG